MSEQELKPGTRVEWLWYGPSGQIVRVIPATVSEWTKNKLRVWVEFESRGLKLRKMVTASTLRIAATAAV